MKIKGNLIEHTQNFLRIIIEKSEYILVLEIKVQEPQKPFPWLYSKTGLTNTTPGSCFRLQQT